MGLDLSLSQSKNEARKEIYETDCHLLSGGPQTAGDGKEKTAPGGKRNRGNLDGEMRRVSIRLCGHYDYFTDIDLFYSFGEARQWAGNVIQIARERK